MVGLIAGEDQQFFESAARRSLDRPLHVFGIVKVRLVCLKRAVLAV